MKAVEPVTSERELDNLAQSIFVALCEEWNHVTAGKLTDLIATMLAPYFGLRGPE